MLVADSTDNNVDNNLEVSFIDDFVWRSNVSSVKVDGVTLTSNQYSLTAGKLTINQGVIQLTGSHAITVTADGYTDSQVQQSVTAGDLFVSSDMGSISPNSAGITPYPAVNTVTMTAKDQYGNPIRGYVFKYNVRIIQGDLANPDSYNVGGRVYTNSVSSIQMTPTNDNGESIFQITDSATRNSVSGDSFGVDVTLNDGTVIY